MIFSCPISELLLYIDFPKHLLKVGQLGMDASGGGPKLLLNALKPMLGINGDIKTPKEVMRIVEFLFGGGWGILNRWLNEYIRIENYPMLNVLIEVLKCLPVTIDVLKQGNTGKIIKQMTRIDNSEKGSKGNQIENGKKSQVSEDSSPSSNKRQRQDSVDEKEKPPPEKKVKQLDGGKQIKNITNDQKPTVIESFGFMNAMAALSSKPIKKKKKLAAKTMLPLDEILNNRSSDKKNDPDNIAGENFEKGNESGLLAEDDSSMSTLASETKGDKPDELSNDSSSTKTKKKRSIKWADDDNLTKIFYFELNEEERAMMHHSVSFNAAKHNELIREREALEHARRVTEDRMVEKLPWTRPCLVEFPPLPIEYGEKSREKYVQKEREQKVLADIFLTKASLPDSPAEPDGDDEEHGPADPKLIPHDEEGTLYPKPSVPVSQVNLTNLSPQNSNESSSILGDAPGALLPKGKDISPIVHNNGDLSMAKSSNPSGHPGQNFSGSRPPLSDMSGHGAYPPAMQHRIPLRGSSTGGPRPLLGMPFPTARGRGSFRARPMMPRAGQMMSRFQRPTLGQDAYSGVAEEHAFIQAHIRSRGRGGIPIRGRGVRETPMCRHFLAPNGCRKGQACQFVHPWVNGQPR
eukprot:gene15989-17599_t